MRIATAKDLRQKTAALLTDVRRGQEIVITYRGKQVAVLSPLQKTAHRDLGLAGFGMWRGRGDMRSVERWLRNLRRPRYGR